MVYTPPGIRGKFKNALKRNDMDKVKDIIEVLMGVGLSDGEILKLLDITDDFYYTTILKHIERPKEIIVYKTINKTFKEYAKLKQKYRELSQYLKDCKNNFVKQRVKLIRNTDLTKNINKLTEVMAYLSEKGWMSNEVYKIVEVVDFLLYLKQRIRDVEAKLPTRASVKQALADD